MVMFVREVSWCLCSWLWSWLWSPYPYPYPTPTPNPNWMFTQVAEDMYRLRVAYNRLVDRQGGKDTHARRAEAKCWSDACFGVSGGTVASSKIVVRKKPEIPRGVTFGRLGLKQKVGILLLKSPFRDFPSTLAPGERSLYPGVSKPINTASNCILQPSEDYFRPLQARTLQKRCLRTPLR